MRGSTKDLPVSVEIPDLTLRNSEWGDMAVELGHVSATIDPSPLFIGLPDNRCQSPHWGYVVKGVLRYKYADHEEVFRAGDAYYAPPGHTPLIEADTDYVEFSPKDLIRQTMEVVGRNMDATNNP
jgi:hypothetical protein